MLKKREIVDLSGLYLDNFNTKDVLITGGGGYLGSMLAKGLCKYARKVYLLDISFNTVSMEVLRENNNAVRLESDITNLGELELNLQNCMADYIFHFAGLLDRNRDFTHYPTFNKVNVLGTFNILQALRKVEYDKFIFASTSEVYGNENTPPFTEDMEAKPISPYSLSKNMAEILLRAFSINYQKPYTVLRLFNFYGPSMPLSFFTSQLESALKNDLEFKMTLGKQRRDYLSVDKLIDYILRLTIIKESDNEIINVCSGKSVYIRDFAHDFAKKLDKLHLLKIGALEYRNNEVWESVGDKSKLERLIGNK